MFGFSHKRTVDDEMSRVIGSMESINPASDEYGKIAKNLETLSKVKSEKGGFKISGDAVFSGLAMIVSTVVVLYFEKTDVISSKAFGWIGKKL